jgi:DNA uptake protein ComE-like DNA-binding protein
MAINGEEAMIRVGDEQQIEISRQTSEGLVTSLEAVEAYTQLAVTPTITEDRYVRMDLKISSDAFSAPGGRAVTQTTRRSTENSVLVQDGQTVVIGGLIQESEESTDYGIPFLKDIPVLGHLFKTTSVTTNKRELVIFLTPHVAEDPAEVKRTTQRVSDDLQQLSPLPVNINIAPVARLARLQGLAAEGTEEDRLELAENIVEYREQNGPFRSYKELENVPGITDDIVANIIYRTELRIDLNTVSIDDLVAIKGIDHQLARKIINEREKRRLYKSVSSVRKMIIEANVDSSYYDEYLRQIFYVTGMRDSLGEAPAQPIRSPQPANDEKPDTSSDSEQSDWQRETLPGLPQE